MGPAASIGSLMGTQDEAVSNKFMFEKVKRWGEVSRMILSWGYVKIGGYPYYILSVCRPQVHKITNAPLIWRVCEFIFLFGQNT